MSSVASSVLLVLWTGVLVSCKTAGSGNLQIQEYYNLDSLISGQIIMLVKKNAWLYKKATVNESTEEKQIQLDSAGWARELALFREANINKPAFSKAYSVKKAEKDIHSNLLFDMFTPINDEDLRIKVIRVYYLDEINSLRKIDIVKEEKNDLFYSSLIMTMYFDESKKEVLLHSYIIKGKQKLRLKDTVSYTIEASIKFP